MSSQYLVGPTVTGNTGVGVGDGLTVEAFYDPLHATLAYQSSSFTIRNFDAQYAGLRITVGELVWQTTGPLSINTSVERRGGNVVGASIAFLGSTSQLELARLSVSPAIPATPQCMPPRAVSPTGCRRPLSLQRKGDALL